MKKSRILKICFSFLLVLVMCNIGTNVKSAKNEVDIYENDDVKTEETNNAQGILDSDATTGTYKFSEGSDIYLPFVRYSSERILIDKKLTGFGTCFAAKNIEVNSDIEGVQVLFAADSIRVNNKMEYGILFASANVTISSNINKSLIIFGGEKVTIAKEAVIGGDIICFTPNLEVSGQVKGSIVGAAENVTVNGKIGKDLRIQTSSVDLSENMVDGEVYLETYNSELSLPESYKNSKINVLTTEEDETFDFSILYTAIITAAVFTLIYFIINKVTKDKLFTNSLERIKKNPVGVILSGSILLLAIPVVVILLIFLSALGLYMVGIPMLIIYSTYLLILGLLSTFVVGSLITEYMAKTKYLKDKYSDVKIKYVFSFVMFFVLYILARLPYVSGYLTIILVILSIGCVTCSLIPKNDNKNDKLNVESNEIDTENLDKENNANK